MSILLQPCFHDERAALGELERLMWPDGPICPHCGAADRIGSVIGKGARPGLKFCCRCRRQFRATLRTLFEGSHVPLHKWFQACFLMATSDDRISAHQLHLRLEVTNKTALCMVRRLREALHAGSEGAADGAASAERVGAVERPRPRWRNRTGSRSPSRIGPGVVEGLGFEVDAFPWVKPPLGASRQFLGFVEVARELGCDEDGVHFAEALKRVVAQPGRSARAPTQSSAVSAAANRPDVASTSLWPLPQMSSLPLSEEAEAEAAGAKLR
jgi:hypothetical protein